MSVLTTGCATGTSNKKRDVGMATSRDAERTKHAVAVKNPANLASASAGGAYFSLGRLLVKAARRVAGAIVFWPVDRRARSFC